MPEVSVIHAVPPGRQRGQALPLGLAMLLVGALGGLVLYNSGQSAIDKARLVNAADAAAYSGAQWQARALNFQAYTNRAMVANQVSMAQAVTLESWTTYGQIMTENIATVLSGVPYVNGIAAGVQTVMTTLNSVMSPIAGAMLSVVDGINAGIGVAQSAMFASTFAATPAVVKAVVEGSDARFEADTAYGVLGALGNLRDWYGFTDRVGQGEDDYAHMRERADIIRQSQDDFTKNRDWDFFGGYLYIAPGVKIEIAKEGRTDLFEREGDNGLEWEWKAKDALSFHTRVNLLFTRTHLEVPIGYGGSFANNSDDGNSTIEEGACEGYASWSGDCARMLDENERAESTIDANTVSLRGTESLVPMSGYSGLREFRRLADTTREKAFPTLRLRVEAAMPLSGTPSSDSLTRSDTFRAPLVARAGMASSISIAEAYFKPPDADLWVEGDTLEFANAYSPFWSVRLAPVSAAERLAAFALRSGDDSAQSGGQAQAPDSGRGSGNPGSSGVDRLLAESVGVSSGEVAGLMGGAVGSGAMNIADAVAREFGDQMLGDVVDDIQEQLEDKLHDAVADILAGIVRGAVASVIGEDTLQTIENLEEWVAETDEQTDTDALNETAEMALGEVTALQDEFRRVDEVLTRDFAPYFDAQVADWRSRWSARIRRLADARNRPFRLFTIPHPSSVEDGPLRTLATEARIARRELLERLSLEYGRIVNGASEEVDLTPRETRQLVSVLLTAYEDANGEEMDFTLFGDVDMALPESGETADPGTTAEADAEREEDDAS